MIDVVRYGLQSFKVTDLQPDTELELRLPPAQRPERIMGLLTHGEFRKVVWLKSVRVGMTEYQSHAASLEHICTIPLPASPQTTPESQLWRGALHPEPCQPGQIARLTIQNVGNAPISGTLSIEMGYVL